MIGRSPLIVALMLIALSGGHTIAGQSGPEAQSPQSLAHQLEQRFDVLVLRDGVALRPKSPTSRVGSVEVAGGAIAVNGAPVSGAELRGLLGRDADLVLQVSYLDPATVRTLFGSQATPAAPANPSQSPLPSEPADSGRRSAEPNRDATDDWGDDDMVRIGSNIRIEEGQIVQGDVVAIGGSVHVDGHVTGNVVAVMGSAELGAHAVVDGNLAVVGGSIRRADGARVSGRVREVGLSGVAGDWTGRDYSWNRWGNRGGASVFSLFATVSRGIVVSLLAVLVVLLAGGYVDQIGAQATAEPFKAGAIGLLAQLLFLPLLIVTIVVLVVTLILIPLVALVPFLILGLVVAALVGFTAVAKQLGEVAARRLSWTPLSPYLATLTGIAVILLPVLLARLALAAGGTGVSFLWHAVAFVGLCLEYLVWTVGFGAVALARFGRKPIFGSRSQPSTLVEG